MTSTTPDNPASASSLRSVGILGAGVCGLAAASHLLRERPDLKVTLLESEDRPGGLARSLTFQGLTTDLGPHRLHTELAGILEVVKDLAGSAVVEVRRSSRMWLANRWVHYPPRPLEMLGVLGPFRLAAFTGSYVGAHAKSLISGASKPEATAETFQSMMERAFGPRLYRYLVRPYAEKVWKSPPETLHADVARVRVSAGGLNKLVQQALGGGSQAQDPAALRTYHYVKGGIGRLAEHMATEIERRGGMLQLRRTVVRLDRRPDSGADAGREPRWRVTHCQSPPLAGTAQTPQQASLAGSPSGSLDARIDSFDALVSTIPVTDLVAMLGSEGESARALQAAGRLRFLANILVFLVINAPVSTANQWLYFPHADVVFNRGYVPANFDPSLGRTDRHLICLEVTCFPGDATWSQSDDQIATRVADDAQRIGLVPGNTLASTHIFRIPYTYPFYDLEYRHTTDGVWGFLREVPALLSVGRQGLFLHNNIDHSIFMGLAAAGEVLRNPGRPGPGWYSRIREFQGFRIVD